MTTLEYIADKFNINTNQRRQPIDIPNTGRETLAELLTELELNVGAEIGVERGLYSEVLCQKNPNIELYSIDAWTAYTGYRDHVTQEKLDEIYADASRRLSPYNATLIKGFSADVSENFVDESLDFVYIDGNHDFPHVVEDLCHWVRKVKVGGIVAGHDYVKRKNDGYLMHVIPAIHGYIEAYDIKPLMILGRKERIQGELRDSPRSWMFVKQAPRPIVPGHNQPY